MINDFINLKSITIILITLSVIIVIFLKSTNRIIFSLFEFTDESLSKQSLFKLSLAGPFFLALLLCFPLWFNPDITLNPSAGGYENFLKLFKLPIGIWSLSIPLVAIVAHIHRTIQTASQIETTKKKNLSDSFFAHHKFITEAVVKLPSYEIDYSDVKYSKKIESPFSLYRTIFPTSSFELGFSPKGLKEYIYELEITLNNLSARIEEFRKHKTNTHEKIILLSDIAEGIKSIDGKLHIPTFRKEINYLYMVSTDNIIYTICISQPSEKTLKNDLKATLDTLRKLLELMNLQIDINDSLYFYAYSESKTQYLFEDIFMQMITYKMFPGVGIHTDYKKESEVYTRYLGYIAARDGL